MNDRLPQKKFLVPDLIAGLVNGISNIPDAMASAILAGVNPIYGLYAVMIGTPFGSLFTSSHLMAIGTTSAIAITTGSALAGLESGQIATALFTLTLMVGVIQVLAGLLRLGRLMRYVSNAVMVGFLTGISALVVLSQLGDFTGFKSEASNRVLQAVDLIFNLRLVHAQTFAVGLLTVVLIIWLDRTRLKNFSMLIAIALASVLVLILRWETVLRVGDVSAIPRGLPALSWPDLSMLSALVAPAISIAIIALVQGAGVSKGYKNPDGEYPDVSQDFIGQGAANVAAGLFQGMPIGGSVGSTALVASAGGKSRWANIYSGLVAIAIVLLLAGVIEVVAIPAMAALLIVAGFQSLDFEEIRDVWEVGWFPRIVMVITLLATLSLPVQYAVFFGVILSVLLNFISASQDIRLVELISISDGRSREQEPPKALPSHAFTVLQVYGTLFFATVEKLGEILPSPKNAESPVVILRLRQHRQITSSFINLLDNYDEELRAVNGRLILTGINPRIKQQLDVTETIQDSLGEEDVFLASTYLGESTQEAMRVAQGWLQQTYPDALPRKLSGANMDIDLTTPVSEIDWPQAACPWNLAENTEEHKCAVKNTSICPYFRGIEYLDVVVCSYPINSGNSDTTAGLA